MKKLELITCRKVYSVVILGLLLLAYCFACYHTGLIDTRLVIPQSLARRKNSTDGPPVEDAIRTRVIQTGDTARSFYSDTLGKLPTNPQYHRRWDVNCSAIFAGSERVITSVGKQLQHEQQEQSLMPSDSKVVTWTNDCTLYKKQRGYPTTPNSDEEAGFPLAYILVVHTGAAQVERLLRAIYHPQNVYCLHPDSKSPREFHQAIAGLANCFDNVFIASKLEYVVYAGFTLLLTNINCMKDLTGRPASGHPWRYVMNLCGQDFPLKTNLEIVRQLKAHNGQNDIESFVPDKRKSRRTEFKFIVRNKSIVRTKSRNGPAPHQLKLYKGSAYYAVTRDFVRYILSDPVAIDFLDWTRNTHMPEETYWATLQRAPGVPGGNYRAGPQIRLFRVRYVLWYTRASPRKCRGKYVRWVCIFTIGDIHYVQQQPHLFANKFYYDYDPVSLQCLEEALEFRVRHK
ncbi:beta-1,3-galactosyl-O-glycosyl-glycoprotein beta-1,6-N-acetylglucosaminyltransferase 4-like [Patiria miniata]|uniref:Beta-1,3-galactosyl-O-glycosyl-glycoprotein beta-1,6-N-acetylglucosaminyltransferase n=1 Tax=Patiria miniata TaxID=46514 RepID=A0A914BD27_PATMI|nr:beta-1,3-galactosyl-O-glycosyl-glycoprotein beta-1,6-N-acetylglucosaminyltransferase 4-like [Patiria miniata]